MFIFVTAGNFIYIVQFVPIFIRFYMVLLCYTTYCQKKVPFYQNKLIIFFFSFTAMFQRRTYKKCNCVTHHQAKRE